MKSLIALIAAYLIILAGLIGFYLYTKAEFTKMTEKITIANFKNSELETSLRTMEAENKKQASELVALHSKTDKAAKEYEASVKIFNEHNLTRIAKSKPTLLEARINAATESLIQEAMNETTIK